MTRAPPNRQHACAGSLALGDHQLAGVIVLADEDLHLVEELEARFP